MNRSILATVTAISLYAVSGAVFAAGNAQAHALSDANTEVSYSEAIAEQARLNNIAAPVNNTNLVIKDYSVDEDESFATRKAEQARLKSLAGKEYKDYVENQFKPVTPHDDPRGTAWAESRRS